MITHLFPSVLRTLALTFVAMALSMQGHAQDDAVQVLTRGPVHEAFAEAAMDGAYSGAIIARGPPEAILELPPEQRPEGDNVSWISGYWSWDEDRSDYIWVSGVWRDLPPGRQWIPGYWTTLNNGAQYVSGFWGELDQPEVTYLMPPPASLERGPSSPAPVGDYLWAPGSWVWQQTRYDWQPGYWVVQQPNWVWTPARYTWTPRGCVHVSGYWDHELVQRGVMFAPVYYAQPVYQRPSYAYSPTIVISLGVVAAFLFVQPRSHHYYYGDYYDHRYEERGFRPWYAQRDEYFGYDYNYASYRHAQLSRDPNWDVYVVDQFRYRRDHLDARPPATFALQINYFDNRQSGQRGDFAIGRTLAEASNDRTRHANFQAVSEEERGRFEERGREVQRYTSERARVERDTESGETGRSRENAAPYRAKLSRSPVAYRAEGNSEGRQRPPTEPTGARVQSKPRDERNARPDGDRDERGSRPDAQQPESRKPAKEARPDQRNTDRVARPESPQRTPDRSERAAPAPTRERKPTAQGESRKVNDSRAERIPSRTPQDADAKGATRAKEAPAQRATPRPENKRKEATVDSKREAPKREKSAPSAKAKSEKRTETAPREEVKKSRSVREKSTGPSRSRSGPPKK